MKKIKLWTLLDQNIVEKIHETGMYRLSLDDLKEKYDDCLDIYLHVYDWFSKKASRASDNDSKYPLLVSRELSPELEPSQDQVLLELEVDETDVIFTDAAKWKYVLNYWYLPKDEREEKDFKAELDARGISNQSKAYMSQFYPDIKNRILKSWDRMFDENIKLSDEVKASVWQIKKEWIVSEKKYSGA